LQLLNCCNNKLKELPKTPVTPSETCESIASLRRCFGNLINLEELYCKSNPFNDNYQNIISKYKYNQPQEMLQKLRDAYLIPTDTMKESYILK
jgi:Leucine-rich repeat (LRR) protein